MNVAFLKKTARYFPPPQFLMRPSAGVDISDRSVKVLALKPTATGYEVDFFGERLIEKGVVVEGKIEKPDALVKVLRTLKHAYKLDTVRVSLPEEHAFLFETHVVAGGGKEDMRAAVEFQIQEHIPIDLQDLIFDFDVTKSMSAERIEISVTAFQKTLVHSYLDVFFKAGFSVLSLEIEAQAIARAAVSPQNSDTNFIIDFGRERSGIAITRGNVPVLTTTIAVGGSALSTAVMKHFKVDEREAEKIKNEQGFLRAKGSEELYESLMSTISALKDEVGKHINYWQARERDRGSGAGMIDAILLVGGNGNLKGLPEYLSASLRVPVRRANIWQNVTSFDNYIPPINKEHSLGYATAVGLALSSE